ncbi:hypothetical protein NC651_035821 [Populus alba x Populus x berolinensis]|nr:hypothetical protein NC651_035821 [Populus alba x Populus x berolinensis]
MFGYLQLACVLLLGFNASFCNILGGGLLLLNVFGFCPFRCDGALVRHCILVFESTWGVPCARTMPGKLKAIEGNRDRRRLVTDIKERCIINYHPWHVFVRRSEMICFFGILEDKLHVYLLETSVLAFKLRMHYASLYKLNDRKKCLKKPRTIAIKYLSESRFYQIRPEVDGTSMYDVQIAFIFPMLQNTKNSISPWNQSEIENGHEISLQDLSQGTCNETAAIRTKRFII